MRVSKFVFFFKMRSFRIVCRPVGAQERGAGARNGQRAHGDKDAQSASCARTTEWNQLVTP
ncbi:hypothetical protein AJ87_15210 [Rhizobium yanglingense]|nr:hypothetical protein AJ87_15210 [Rhizobium yanglingense]